MYKAGKNWLFTGIGIITFGSAVTLANVNAQAAEKQPEISAIAQKSTQTTPTQQATIDDAQATIDQDNRDIAKNQDETAKEQANNDDLNHQTADKQEDITKTQGTSDKTNDQVNKDQDTVDAATPDGYDDVQNAKAQAETDANKAQADADKAQTQQDAATKAAKEAADKAAKAQADKDAATKAKADAQANADAAKSKVDNTDKTVKIHHDGKEPKPGTITTGTEVNSEADLPTHLVKPSDADKYNSYNKQVDAGATLDSYWNYVGANDTSEKIKNGILTPQQQLEAAQYALTLINDFRHQHGLKPMKMSTLSLQMAQYDAEMRAKYGVVSSDHSFAGSEEQGGVTQTEWNQSILKKLYPSFSGNLSKSYLLDDQDLGGVNVNSAPTMLAMKVRILQNIQDMAFADMDWDNGDGMGFHTASLLRNYPGDLWFSLNITVPDSMDESAMIFDIFGTYDNEIGKQLNEDFSAQPVTEMQSGYDTIESNPAYTQAIKKYQNALTNLANANNAYTQANNNASSTASASTLAQKVLTEATAQLKTARTNLVNAKAKLADATKALADATAKYGDQLNAYNAAKATLEADQAKAAQLAKDLVNAKQALANNQSAIATSDAKIKSLKDQLAQLQVKLAKDEKTLADAKAAAENNGSDTDNNGDDSNIDPDNNNSGSDDNHNNGSGTDDNESNNNNSGSNSDNNGDNSDTNQDANDSSSDNGGSNVNNNGSNTNSNNSDHSFNTNSELTTNDIVNSNSRSNNVTTNNLSFINSQNTTVITPAQVAAKTVTQQQLPQTGDQVSNKGISLLGVIGLALSSLGLISVSKRKHN